MNDLDVGSEERPFGPNEEKSIISLVLDSPEFFSSVGHYFDYDYFHQPEARYVFSLILDYYIKHDVAPTRELVRDAALKHLKAEDPWEDIIELIDRASNPRELPIIKSQVLAFVRDRAYGQIYSEEAFNAYEAKNYEFLEETFEKAKRITDASGKGLFLLDTPEILFLDECEEKLTTGYKKLDSHINMGGPTRGDTFFWMAPTGVGKSIMLCNSGVACFRRGLKVLHVTLELSKKKTAERYAGIITNEKIQSFKNHRNQVEKKLSHNRSSYDGDIAIYEFPPDEISVDHIYQTIYELRRAKGWDPDVVIIDYLELMVSRNTHYNKEDYIKQKKVSVEVRGLAKNENVLLFTATQTNRGGFKGDEGLIDLDKIAESYGKAMATDYVVSLNQTPEEYNAPQPRLRFWIAKNRNGPKSIAIRAKVDYNTMRVEEDTV